MRCAKVRLTCFVGVLLAFSHGSAASLPADCPHPGPVIAASEARSVYRDDDPTRSMVDRERQAENRVLSAPTRKFQSVLARLADQSLVSPASNARLCMKDLLAVWAEGGGFLQPSQTPAGNHAKVWLLSTVGFSVLKAGLVDEVRATAAIREWALELTDQAIYFSLQRSTKNNLTYWASLAVLMGFAIAGDERLLRISDVMHDRDLKDIRLDGLLTAELARGARATQYHLFAAQPLYLYELVRGRLLRVDRIVPERLDALLTNAVDALRSGSIAPDLGLQLRPAKVGWLSIYCTSKKLDCPT